MITEDYVSFETAKLLKEKGFKLWCYKCYGGAVCYKGVPISFDEECELKDEGRENEIEYVEGGYLYDFGCDNSEKDTKVWAAPTLQMARKWLRKVHTIDIVITPSMFHRKYNVCIYKDENLCCVDFDGDTLSPSYEEACDSAIKYCLENLI